MMNVSQAVTEFGQSMGIEGLNLGSTGVCQLQWEDGSTLLIEETAEELLVCLAFPAAHLHALEMQQALELQDQRVHHGFAVVQVGLRGQGADTLIVTLVRVRARVLAGADIARSVDQLTEWRSRWESLSGRRSH